MRNSLLAIAGAATALWAASQAQAATLIPVVPVPGSAATTVFDINDNNVIAGSYRDANGIEHGFFGTLDGKYTTFDFGHNSTGTEPRAIGNDGGINGIAFGNSFTVGKEFYRDPTGKIEVYKKDRQPFDGVIQKIDSHGVSVGDYFNASGARAGYLGKAGKYKRDFRLPVKNFIQSSPRALTGTGVVAGYFIDSDDAEHGFILQGNALSVIDYPDKRAILTVLEDINDKGAAAGQWNDARGNPHAFVLNTATGNFTPIEIDDGSAYQQAWGVNRKGLVAVSTGAGNSYIYCPLKKCPKSGAKIAAHPIHVRAGTFLHYDGDGRTGRNLPAMRFVRLAHAPEQ